jgi:hypothetical protein
MIRIEFPPQNDIQWDQWVTRCEEERDRVVGRVASGKKPGIRRALYTAQRQRYLAIAFGKCAYCESRIAGTQDGDVEHFRPKAGITNLDHNPVMITDAVGVQRAHPGYYWLAYDSTNLLASCIICNQPRGRRPKLRGKWNRFPVIGQYARSPGEEAAEHPLLVHPYRDIPEQHMRFDPVGVIVPLTERGDTTVTVLDLNRETLVQARHDTYMAVRGLFRTYYAAQLAGSPEGPELLKFLQDYLSGAQAFSAIGRVAISDEEKKLSDARAALHNPNQAP